MKSQLKPAGSVDLTREGRGWVGGGEGCDTHRKRGRLGSWSKGKRKEEGKLARRRTKT